MSVGKRIKLIRKRNNLTQVQLAEKLGLKQATIGRYENGSITPSLFVLMRISKKLSVDIGWLFSGEMAKDEQVASEVKYKYPDIVKKATEHLQGNKLKKLSTQHEMAKASVKRKVRLVNEVRELRKLAQELMDRIIILQEDIKEG